MKRYTIKKRLFRQPELVEDKNGIYVMHFDHEAEMKYVKDRNDNIIKKLNELIKLSSYT